MRGTKAKELFRIAAIQFAAIDSANPGKRFKWKNYYRNVKKAYMKLSHTQRSNVKIS